MISRTCSSQPPRRCAISKGSSFAGKAGRGIPRVGSEDRTRHHVHPHNTTMTIAKNARNAGPCRFAMVVVLEKVHTFRLAQFRETESGLHLPHELLIENG